MTDKIERSEKTLELSHFTIESAGDAIFWHGPDARFQRVNEAACRHLGYSREELLRMTVYDINPDLGPEGFQGVWDEIREKGHMSFETRHRTRDGRIVPVEVSCNFIEYDGKGYCCSFVRDISRRKEIEKKLRFSDVTIEKAPDTVFWVDSQARICRVNDMASRRLGYTREEILSMTVFDINPDLTQDQWNDYWQTLRENKVLTIETRHRRKDGSVFPVEVLQNFVVFEEQEYTCGFVRDITERKRAEKELTRLTLEKERIENELKFASLIQKEFLPENPPTFPGYVFAAQTIPARFVGGDFFDFIRVEENHLGIVLGDVAGKGVSAALHMARLMSDFRNIVQTNAEPSRVMNEVNRLLQERARRGMFATALYILIDLQSKTLQAANAGHHPILIRKPNNQIVQKLKSGGIPLGIIPESPYTSEEFNVESGDLVLLFSDGAVEPTNEKKEPFGMERLCRAVSSDNSPPPNLIQNLFETIARFSAGSSPHDDLTFLAFQVL